jgi:hypothetical protein
MTLWKTGLLTAALVSLTACATASKVAESAKDQATDVATEAADDAADTATEAAEAGAGEIEAAAVADKLGAYFASVNGTNEWDTIEPLFNAVMHDDVVFVTADGEQDKAAWMKAVQGLIAKGATASGYDVSKKEDGAFYYKVTITMSDGTVMEAASKGMVKDGMMVRVEPVDPEVYSKLSEAASN